MDDVARAGLEGQVALLAQVESIRRIANAWVAGGAPALMQPRDWSTAPESDRRVEFVPEVEIAAARGRSVDAGAGEGIDWGRDSFSWSLHQRKREVSAGDM